MCTHKICMPKKKIKEKRIHFLLDKVRYDKLLKCAGEYNTLTEILNKSIDGYYYSMFKTNDVIDTSIPSNREVVKQLQEQHVDKDQITLNEVLDEQAELEKLKAIRRARKSGDNHD